MENIYKNVPLYTLDLNENSSFPFWIGKNKFSKNAPLHQHQYIQINYISHGSGVHEVKGQQVPVSVGNVFVMPPYVPHRILPSEDSSFVHVIEIEFLPEFLNQQFNNLSGTRDLFDFRYISLFLDEEAIHPSLYLTNDAQKDANRIIQKLFQEYQEQLPLFEYSFKALLLELLVVLNRTFYSYNPEPTHLSNNYQHHQTIIQNVLKYIDLHFSENLRIEDMAKLSAMSQSYFCYFFKLFVGRTFTQYLIDKRIEYAKTLLSQSNLSVTQIAFDAGFNSMNHFIRTFRLYNQISPGQYRKLTQDALTSDNFENDLHPQ